MQSQGIVRQRYDATKFAGTIPSSTHKPTPSPRGAHWPTPPPRGVTCGQHGGIGAGFSFDSDLGSVRFRWARGTRRGLILALTAIMSVTATGCLVGPNYKSPFMKLPALWSGGDAKSEVGAGQGAKTDLAEWWRSFDDPRSTR